MNNKLKHLSLLAILIVSLGLITSCGTKKQAVPVRDTSWHTLSVPVKLSTTSPLRVSMSGKAFLVNDSLINVSVRLLGMEVGGVRVTADTITCLDRFHGYILEVPMAEITKSTGLRLMDIQDILLGKQELPANIKKYITLTVKEAAEPGLCPQSVNVKAIGKDREIAGTITYTPNKAEIDKGNAPKWKRPKDYQAISYEQLLDILREI